MKTPRRDAEDYPRRGVRLSREVLDFLALLAAVFAATLFFGPSTERSDAASPNATETSDEYEDMIGI